MTIKFRNPWIDRRVAQVRSAAARDYLLRHGWEPLDTPDTAIKLYAGPVADGYAHGIVQLITNLAILEDRTAVEVLEEMLGVTTPSGTGAPAAKAPDAAPAPTA
jgi:hypothetical protein